MPQNHSVEEPVKQLLFQKYLGLYLDGKLDFCD